MKPSRRRALAEAIARQLPRMTPRSRADWAEAMRSEISGIEDPGEALRFSLGCLRACARERLRSLELLLGLARRLMTAGTAAFAMIALFSAIRVHPLDPASAFVFGVIALAFGSASLLLARKGPAGSAAISAAMLVPSLYGLLGPGAAAWERRQAALYHALALEGLLLWSLLLAASLALLWASRSAWLRDRARQKGWS